MVQPQSCEKLLIRPQMIKMELLLDVLVVLVVVAWAGQEELVVEELRLVTGKKFFYILHLQGL